jgi:hypothetical protein
MPEADYERSGGWLPVPRQELMELLDVDAGEHTAVIYALIQTASSTMSLRSRALCPCDTYHLKSSQPRSFTMPLCRMASRVAPA